MAKEIVKALLEGGAKELFTESGQSHEGIVRSGRDLVSPDGKTKIRGYGPSDAQGVVRVYGPWSTDGMWANYRYFIQKNGFLWLVVRDFLAKRATFADLKAAVGK